jgi:hypothetical protein
MDTAGSSTTSTRRELPATVAPQARTAAVPDAPDDRRAAHYPPKGVRCSSCRGSGNPCQPGSSPRPAVRGSGRNHGTARRSPDWRPLPNSRAICCWPSSCAESSRSARLRLGAHASAALLRLPTGVLSSRPVPCRRLRSACLPGGVADRRVRVCRCCSGSWCSAWP